MEKSISIPLSSLSINRFLYHKGNYPEYHKNVKAFVKDYFKDLPKANGKISIQFISHFKDECNSVDPDNTVPAVKAIIDAIKGVGIIEDDSCKYIDSIILKSVVDGEHKIVVTITYL